MKESTSKTTAQSKTGKSSAKSSSSTVGKTTSTSRGTAKSSSSTTGRTGSSRVHNPEGHNQYTKR